MGAFVSREKLFCRFREASLSRLRRLLAEFSGFTRITGQSDVFQRASNCISASVNWAPYGIVLAERRAGCILRPIPRILGERFPGPCSLYFDPFQIRLYSCVTL
jgi:hypothetical protein